VSATKNRNWEGDGKRDSPEKRGNRDYLLRGKHRGETRNVKTGMHGRGRKRELQEIGDNRTRIGDASELKEVDGKGDKPPGISDGGLEGSGERH